MKDAILKRVSTRTYKKETFKPDEIQKIYDIIKPYNTKKGPFDHKALFNLNLRASKTDVAEKIGTYGFIKNAPLFAGGVCLDKREAIIDYGYIMELLILDLTQKNYQTCWLGGTFNKKHINIPIPQHHIIPAITPVGHQAEKMTLMDKLIRRSVKASSRRSLDEIIFRYKNDDEKLDITLPYMHALTLVRKAPSASNKQPWRIYLDDNDIHFYLYHGEKLAGKNNYLDMGIAFSHFEIGLQADAIPFVRYLAREPLAKEGQEYILSYRLSK